MKINVKKEVKSYMKPYSYRFRCSRKHKKALYDLMASTGEEFLDINPMATIEDLHKYWGHPANIFEDFQETIGPKEIWKSYRRSLWLTAAICITAALVFILIAYWIIIHYAGTVQIIYLDC